MPDSNDMPTSGGGSESGRENPTRIDADAVAAATAHIDEDPARMPHRDPSPAPPAQPAQPAPRPTHTESPLPGLASPHAVLHEGDDHHRLQQHRDPGRTPDPQQEDPYRHHDQDQRRDEYPEHGQYQTDDQYQQHDQYQHDEQYSQHSYHDDQRSHSGIVAADSDDTHDEDEFELTDGYETASTGSTSVTSSIYAHTFENGRRYQHFKNGRYPIPNDDEELNREDMKHAMLMELCDGQLFYAPIGKNPHKILDVGTGTGEWIPAALSQGYEWQLTIRQAFGQSRLATSSLTPASAASTCLPPSPCGYRQTSTSSSTTANRASGSTRITTWSTSGS